jgi:hypothetical protein
VDYRAARVTYYLPDGNTLDLALEGEPAAVASEFSAAALIAAIRAAQRGDVMYPQFKKLSGGGLHWLHSLAERAARQLLRSHAHRALSLVMAARHVLQSLQPVLL